MSGLMSKQVPDAVEDVWRLTDIEISFVSACPQGANPGAKILLKKERVMPGTNEFKKEDGGEQKINVSLDTEALAKSMSDSLKNTLGDLLKKQDITAEAAAEACTAVLAGDIAKMQKDINDQLQGQLSTMQKEMDDKIAALQKQDISKSADESITVNGTTFQKSAVGDATFNALKAAFAQSEAIRKELEAQKLQARVEKEYPNVAGEPALKAAFLGLIEKADDKVKEYGLSVLKSLNDTSGEYAKEIGSNNADNASDMGVQKMATDTDASMKLDAMAKELAAKEGISVSKAYAKVLATEEGGKLYDQHCGR